MSKKRLCLDFDGVLHSYTSGYVQGREDEVLDPPVPGAIEALCEYVRRFEVYIFSTRCTRPAAIESMSQWFVYNGLPVEVLDQIIFTATKQPVWLTLDDRAVQFHGTFPSVKEIEAFKPWNRR